jgi:hypothetical protein
LEDFKLRCVKRYKEEMLEGELIKRQVDEDLEREKQKEVLRMQKVQQNRADLARANREQMQLKEAERLADIAQA